MVYIETTPNIAMYAHALLGEPSQCKSALGRLTSTQHHGPAANHAMDESFECYLPTVINLTI